MVSLALIKLKVKSEKGLVCNMSKSSELLSEAVRNPKNPFRQTANQPDKAHKHRYERRKIKQFIYQGDWTEES